jgi:hypothetical protein
MKSNKVIKISVAVVILLIALWFAAPSAYTNNFNYNGASLLAKTEPKVETQEPSDIDYNKPVYFNIFKFVNGLIPGKK